MLGLLFPILLVAMGTYVLVGAIRGSGKLYIISCRLGKAAESFHCVEGGIQQGCRDDQGKEKHQEREASQ